MFAYRIDFTQAMKPVPAASTQASTGIKRTVSAGRNPKLSQINLFFRRGGPSQQERKRRSEHFCSIKTLPHAQTAQNKHLEKQYRNPSAYSLIFLETYLVPSPIIKKTKDTRLVTGT